MPRRPVDEWWGLPGGSVADPERPIAGAATEVAAVRDAQTIAARIARDEAAADEARRQYLTAGLPTIEPDAAFAAVAQPEEQLHAIRTTALLETGSGVGTGLPRGGTLYLSSARILHLGTQTTEVRTSDIAEMAVVLERLILIRRRDGSDLAIEVDQPRLLRVQLASAIAAERARAGTS